jgi:hypothetical protein
MDVNIPRLFLIRQAHFSRNKNKLLGFIIFSKFRTQLGPSLLMNSKRSTKVSPSSNSSSKDEIIINNNSE